MAKEDCRQRSASLRVVASWFLVAGATVTTSNTARADTIFFDNFAGSILNPSWQVLPGQGGYSVGGGQLRYYNDGSVASTTGWYNPALTLALPFTGTNWEIDTKATYNLHWLDSFGNSSGAQGPEVLVKFNPAVTTSGYGGPDYAGGDYAVIERDIDACTGCTPANYLFAGYGAAGNSNLLNPADAGVPPKNNIGAGTYWYQIIRNGGTLTINYSGDGINYAAALSAPLADPSGSYNELLLGGATWESAGSHTDYAYVNITAPSSVPEPSSFVLLALGVMGVAVKRFRSNKT
jgi:hypothetical protein